MKLGDIVYSTTTRPKEHCTVVQVDISKRLKDDGKTENRVKYMAKYNDGTYLNFYGAQVGVSIFKAETEENHQMTIDDYLQRERLLDMNA